MAGINSEKLAPQLLLKRGVSVPVPAPLFLRVVGQKHVKLTLYHPTNRTLLKIAELYLKMHFKDKDFGINEAMNHFVTHNKKVRRIVALGFLNSPHKNWMSRILGWWLAGKMTAPEFHYIYHLLILHGGVEDFTNTIRLIGKSRITKPMNQSQVKKTS